MTKHAAERKSAPRSKAHRKMHGHEAHHNSTRPPRRSKAKFYNFENLDAIKILLGVAAAGIAGTAAFMLFAPKRNPIEDFYESFSDVREDAADLASDTWETGKHAYHAATDFAENVKEKAQDWIDSSDSKTGAIAAAVGGVLLGASLIYLINQHAKNDLSDELYQKAKKYGKQFKHAADEISENISNSDWLNKIRDVVETIIEKVAEFREEHFDEGRSSRLGLGDAFNFAIAGLRLWDKYYSKR